MPERVFDGILPELITLFAIPDNEIFVQTASEIAAQQAARPPETRQAIATSIENRVGQLGMQLPEHERNRLFALCSAIVLGNVVQISRLLQNLRNLLPALILLDGDANTTLHANVIAGLVSLYGQPGESRFARNDEFFRTLANRIQQGTFQLTVVDGVFQGWGNRLTRFVLGEEVVQRILQPQPNGVERIYRSLLCTDNVLELGENYFLAERLSLASTFFRAGDERPGVSIGRAATFVGNHDLSGDPFINVCRTHEQAANLMIITNV
jgi:hypothetical protein